MKRNDAKNKRKERKKHVLKFLNLFFLLKLEIN